MELGDGPSTGRHPETLAPDMGDMTDAELFTLGRHNAPNAQSTVGLTRLTGLLAEIFTTALQNARRPVTAERPDDSTNLPPR